MLSLQNLARERRRLGSVDEGPCRRGRNHRVRRVASQALKEGRAVARPIELDHGLADCDEFHGSSRPGCDREARDRPPAARWANCNPRVELMNALAAPSVRSVIRPFRSVIDAATIALVRIATQAVVIVVGLHGRSRRKHRERDRQSRRRRVGRPAGYLMHVNPALVKSERRRRRWPRSGQAEQRKGRAQLFREVSSLPPGCRTNSGTDLGYVRVKDENSAQSQFIPRVQKIRAAECALIAQAWRPATTGPTIFSACRQIL